MQKYEFTGDTYLFYGVSLHRIRALRDIKNGPKLIVRAGELGGWIEKESNLSHAGAAWVADEAKVRGESLITGSAYVGGEACISGEATIDGNAIVTDNAIVKDKASVGMEARVYGSARIFDRAEIRDKAKVFGFAKVKDHGYVSGEAQIHGWATVAGSACVCGNASVYGDAFCAGLSFVSGNALIRGDCALMGREKIKDHASLFHTRQIVCIGPIGSREDYTTFYSDNHGGIYVSCGCFNGTIAEFLEAVKECHGDNQHGHVYRAAVAFATNILDNATYGENNE